MTKITKANIIKNPKQIENIFQKQFLKKIDAINDAYKLKNKEYEHLFK